MKKLFFLGTLFLLLSACENELDLVEDWKDIPVVYGILDPSDTAHYIRIEKAFVDKEISALDLARIADSLYYGNLDVKLVIEQGDNPGIYSMHRVDGSLEGYPREPGLFAELPNYLYKINAEELGLKGNETVTLEFQRDGIEQAVKATTKLVGSYDFVRPRPDDPEKINLSYANHLTIRWTRADHAEDYEVYIIVHYREKLENAPATDYVDREVSWKAASNVEDNSVLLESKDVFTFMASAIKTDPDMVRSFEGLEFRVIAVGKELSDYIAVSGANLGITASQEIPLYSNIPEGLGIFSTKWEISIEGLELIPPSLDSLRNGIYTKHLNFL